MLTLHCTKFPAVPRRSTVTSSAVATHGFLPRPEWERSLPHQGLSYKNISVKLAETHPQMDTNAVGGASEDKWLRKTWEERAKRQKTIEHVFSLRFYS